MKKLKVAFLWHQHQPYYRIDDEMILPWVLFHGTKDYFDIPEILYEFPEIKQTFNFAPSLSLQLELYVKGKVKDKIQILTAKPASELSDEEKKEIIRLFFHANFDNMIACNPRYSELYNQSRNTDFAISNFGIQDWLDLQVWYNLVWFGYFSSQSGIVKRLKSKGSNFNESEKLSLIDAQNDILGKINHQYRKLKELRQIELSCSPMFHPIIPLLIDSKSSLESRPGQVLPDPIFCYPEDAEIQVSRGIEYFRSIFGNSPDGLWPSEGAVSDDALKLFINNNIKWIATDEQILHNSVKYENYLPTEKFFPRKFICSEGAINILFRDHFLSDRIGFEYSKWNESDAANDFVTHLSNIRNEIIKNHGEDALDFACVSVVLDGENCWEYYKENGIPFLRELYRNISNHQEITTVTCNEAANNINSEYLKPLNHIYSGSWINANFDIWIGHNEDIKAWNLLSNARKSLEDNKLLLSRADYNKALNNLLVAEGSDWFWWYGPEHHTKNKEDFDKLFRHYLINAYNSMKLEVPKVLFVPVEKLSEHFFERIPVAKIPLGFDFINNPDFENYGYIKIIANNSAMHQSGELVDCIHYANDYNNLFLKIKFLKHVYDFFEVKLFFEDIDREIIVNSKNIIIDFEEVMIYKSTDFIKVQFPIKYFINNKVKVRLETRFMESFQKYPANDNYIITII